MPPKRVPIVSTGSPSSQATSVPPKSATTVAGTRFARRCTATSVASVAQPSAAVAPLHVGSAAPSTSRRCTNSPGTAGVSSPRKSLTCVLAISTAIPLVNPITTGRGMKRTADPRRPAPSAISTTPASTVQVKRPSTPCRVTIPEITTTNAPVGPPIW
jgi:hypothetical protein